MFREMISSSNLTTDAANSFFGNISGSDCCGDVTFISTLRALLVNRIPETGKIHLEFGYSRVYPSEREALTTGSAVRQILGNELYGDRIRVVSVIERPIDQESGTKSNMDFIEENFCSEFGKFWEKSEKITQFYHKSFRVLCFINQTERSVVIFVERMNAQKMHYLQMSIPAFIPWYFDENPVSESELQLLKSLGEKSPESWIRCIDQIANTLDFESIRIKKLLGGLERRTNERLLSRMQRDLSSVDNYLRELDRQYEEKLKERDMTCIRIEGIQKRIDDGSDSELMDCFLCNKRLVLDRVVGNFVYFCVRDYLSYFDEEAAETYINNPNSYFYRYGMDREKLESLLRAIFIDQTIRIRFWAEYKLEVGGDVSPIENACPGHMMDGYRPNPHIDHYGCMGNYRRIINEALRNGDTIAAIEQCVASAKSLNFHDGAVMTQFCEEFVGDRDHYKALELPDGRIVTPVEAIEWLETQDNN